MVFERSYQAHIRVLNEGCEVRECYSCLKLMIQVHLDVSFSTIFHVNCNSVAKTNPRPNTQQKKDKY